MEPKYDIQNVIAKSNYFQNYIEKLLSISQPSFYCLDLIVKVLIHGPDGSGKRLLAKKAAQSLNMNFCEERVAHLFDENVIGIEKRIRACITKFASSAPCLIYFSGYELLCKLEDADLDRIEHCIRESFEEYSRHDNISQPIIFIASTDNFDKVYRSPLSHLFQHSISMRSPTHEEAGDLLKLITNELELNSNIDSVKLLNQCSNGEYFVGNLVNLLGKSEFEMFKQLDEYCDANISQKIVSDEGVRWLDIGGLNDIKREIIDTIQLSLDFPQLKKSGLRRTGVLLFGPPGTGKTLLARAVATECNLKFINVKGPELLNEYVGQSEDNVRKLFQRARDSSPSVIFFDEIDSLAPNRGQAGDSGGVMDRMVSQLLAEMDGVGKSDDIFIIGATNRVDLVDESLLRPGRFDKVLEVPLPRGRENRIEILKALTRKMNLANDVDLAVLESKAKPNMSGADFQGWCSSALHRTFDRCVKVLESGESNEDEVEIRTSMNDFLETIDIG